MTEWESILHRMIHDSSLRRATLLLPAAAALGVLLLAAPAHAEEAASPESASPEAASPATAARPEPTGAATVTVELRSSQPGVAVSAWTGGPPVELPRQARDTIRADGLEPLCTTPCTHTLPVGPLALVAHGARWTTMSDTVELTPATTTLRATPHHRARTTAANVLIGGGIGLAVFGGGLLALNELGPQSIDSRPTAFTLGGAGLGALAGGLVLQLSGRPRWTAEPAAAGSR
jgi:hypothetical protein